MSTTVPSKPEVYHRCRESVYTEGVNSVSLISATNNPADAMTKFKNNQFLEQFIHNKTWVTPPNRLFMLQTSNFREGKFISTSFVAMLHLQE